MAFFSGWQQERSVWGGRWSFSPVLTGSKVAQFGQIQGFDNLMFPDNRVLKLVRCPHFADGETKTLRLAKEVCYRRCPDTDSTTLSAIKDWPLAPDQERIEN